MYFLQAPPPVKTPVPVLWEGSGSGPRGGGVCCRGLEEEGVFLRDPFWSQKWPIFGSPYNFTILKGKRFLSFSLMLWSILARV